ncbi:endonuclease domain-containing protein [Lysobacter sp. CA199]|uniref:endonuclease domain-containing protein n=1 Tax=Lysobacter sp. CA199 TaxID=3455608 RepID=UPI003F8D84C5
MRPYERVLKNPSRRLRRGLSAAEARLWFLVPRQQVLGVPFYRQKPLLGYIVDFYAPAAGLVIEVDGAQHLTQSGRIADSRRTSDLERLGLVVIRFDNLQVLNETVAVMEEIYRVVRGRLEEKAGAESKS